MLKPERNEGLTYVAEMKASWGFLDARMHGNRRGMADNGGSKVLLSSNCRILAVGGLLRLRLVGKTKMEAVVDCCGRHLDEGRCAAV